MLHLDTHSNPDNPDKGHESLTKEPICTLKTYIDSFVWLNIWLRSPPIPLLSRVVTVYSGCGVSSSLNNLSGHKETITPTKKIYISLTW